jgi:hypothetical protein
MHGEGALTATLPTVSKPLGCETSRRQGGRGLGSFQFLVESPVLPHANHSHNHVSQPARWIAVPNVTYETHSRLWPPARGVASANVPQLVVQSLSYRLGKSVPLPTAGDNPDGLSTATAAEGATRWLPIPAVDNPDRPQLWTAQFSASRYDVCPLSSLHSIRVLKALS